MKFRIKKIISAIMILVILMTTFPVASAATIISGSSSKKVYKGIDISRWNGEIDWNKMKKRGVDFAIMRCYSLGKDIMFDQNYTNATLAGIDVGAYVFMYAEKKKEATEEANKAVAALKGKALDYPLFLDIEYSRLENLSRSYLTDLVIRELKIFKKAGYDAGIYCSKSFQEDHLDMERLSEYYIWTAYWKLYSSESDGRKYYYKDMDPMNSSKPDCDIWQFSNGGYGPYYGAESHYLDLDYCYVDFGKNSGSSVSDDPNDYPMPERTLVFNKTSLMSGEDVAWVQSALYQMGYNIPNIDGVYGSSTNSAVKKFQKKYGLVVNGTADTQTVSKIADVYKHEGCTAKIKYDPSDGKAAVAAGTFDYGTVLTLGKDMNFSKKNNYLSGWTLYRESDKKYYCTNGKWQSEEKVKSGKYTAMIFPDGYKLTIDESLLRSSKNKTENYKIAAVWSSQPGASHTIYYKGNVYYVYNGNLSYDDANAFCQARGGSLAELITNGEIKAVSAKLKDGKKYFVGAKAVKNGYKWNSGEKVTQTVSESKTDKCNYLTVSSRSASKLYAVKDETKVSGFIMKAPCSHEKLTVINTKTVTCTKNGYSGDKVCKKCGTIIEKGVKIYPAGHSYGSYVVTKAATCGENGVCEKYCEFCDKVKTKEIQATGDHIFKAKAVKKATTKENGTAYDKCTVCGLKTAQYKVRRIKSISIPYSDYAYDGVKLEPKVTITDKDGNTLVRGTDYTLKYKNNKNVGKATITIKFIGKYGGTVTKTFKIVPKPTKITSTSTKNKSVIIRWAKVSGQSTGYQIACSTTKDFSKNVRMVKAKSPKQLSKTIRNLKRNKTYYFKVRVYKTVGEKNYYSLWTAVRKVTVK